jgi:hypothetical protein
VSLNSNENETDQISKQSIVESDITKDNNIKNSQLSAKSNSSKESNVKKSELLDVYAPVDHSDEEKINYIVKDKIKNKKNKVSNKQ